MLVIEASLFGDNERICLQLDHGAALFGSKLFVQRHANNTETVLFTMFFAFVLYGHKAEGSNMTAYEYEANQCTFWTGCTGVSRKRLLMSNNASLW